VALPKTICPEGQDNLISMFTPLHFGRLVASNLLAFALALPLLSGAQNAFSPGGNDYAIIGGLVGDQTAPQAVVRTNGGVLVWQDNAADGNGLGVRAVRLGGGLNKSGNIFRVNSTTVGDQEKPQVSLLANGGAAIVWQGGKQGFQDIFIRFLNATGTNFVAVDARVNTYTNQFQITPVVASLNNGSVVVVWSSYGQDGDRQGIFAQRYTSAGAKSGGEFQVNQFPLNNQRTPAVAALAGGGFVVAWVSELQRAQNTIDIFGRRFDASGNPSGNEFLISSTGVAPCANPSVVGSKDGGFVVAWSQRDVVSGNSPANEFVVVGESARSAASWDVHARAFGATGAALGSPVRLNTFTYGDQYAPRLSAFGNHYLAVWSSLGQDGSMEGVYGQFMSSKLEVAGVEFQVNTDPGTRQLDPSIGSDGANRFLVTWASFSTGGTVDLIARAFDLIQVAIAPSALGVRISWNTIPGLKYQVQVSANYTTWSDHGSVRTASGYTDNIDVASSVAAAAYRVVRVP